MSQQHTTGLPQRRVTKSEACQILGVSLSTLDRRITEGQLEVERVQQGQVNRVFVLLPAGDMPEDRPDPEKEMAVAQERIRSLEELWSGNGDTGLTGAGMATDGGNEAPGGSSCSPRAGART